MMFVLYKSKKTNPEVEKMTWTEQITVNAMTTLDVRQVSSMFYRMSHAVPKRGLTDIALLRNHGSSNSYCIRLTWHSEIPETGKSSLGLRLAKVFSEKGQTYHTVWNRETSLHLLNELEKGTSWNSN
jgi:hypothetical protein